MTDEISSEASTRAAMARDDTVEISFAELLSTLSTRKKVIVWAVLATAFVSIAIAFLIPVEYTAEAVILTPQQAQPSLSAMAQLAGGGAALPGLSLLTGF